MIFFSKLARLKSSANSQQQRRKGFEAAIDGCRDKEKNCDLRAASGLSDSLLGGFHRATTVTSCILKRTALGLENVPIREGQVPVLGIKDIFRLPGKILDNEFQRSTVESFRDTDKANLLQQW